MSPISEAIKTYFAGGGAKYLLWSNPATWGGTLPVAGDPVLIPAGRTIMFDLTTSPSLGLVTTQAGASKAQHGTLLFDRTKTQTFTCSGFMNNGALDMGDSTTPRLMAAPLDFIATGPASAANKVSRANGGFSSNTGTCRGLLNMSGSVFKAYGETPVTIKTVLTNHLAASATAASVAHTTGWATGSRVLLAPTGLYDQHVPEVLTVASSGANSLAFSAGPVTTRWGVLQYANKTALLTGNMSLTDGGYRHASGNTPNILDQRATLCLLNRAINFSCPNDSDYNTLGHGFVLMCMGYDSTVQISGIRIARGGQQDTQGHYPFHWHNLSYNLTTGAFVSDALNNQYIKRSVIEGSKNRGLVIHGTCGVTADENVLHDIRGQGIFTEDGVERRNIITNNTVSKTTRTVNGGVAGQGLKAFESDNSAGIWLTNPDNTVTGNECFGVDGIGSWFSFATSAFGDNVAVVINPNGLSVGYIGDNTLHSNSNLGHRLEQIVVNEQGNTSAVSFEGAGTFFGFKIWKNLLGGYENRIAVADYLQFVQADNVGQDFFGAHRIESGGLARNCLMVAHSLNDSDTRSASRQGIASYHGSLNPKNCTAIGYAAGIAAPQQNQRQTFVNGWRTLWDLYTTGVQYFIANGGGNELLSSHPGVPVLSPEFDTLGPLINDVNMDDRFRPAIAGYGTPAGFDLYTETASGMQRGWVVAPTGDGGSRMSKYAFGVNAQIDIGAGANSGLSGVGNTWIQCGKPNDTSSDQTLAMSITDYAGQGPLRTQMEYRAVVTTSGAVLFGISAGADAALTTAFSFSAFSDANVVRLDRTGSTVTIQTSTDYGSTFTTRYTFAAITAATVYRYIGAAYSGTAGNDVVFYPRATAHTFRNWKIAPVIWDKNGEWDTANSYLIQNIPYFTYGTTTRAISVGSCPSFVATDVAYAVIHSSDFVDIVSHADTLDFRPTTLYQRINPADDSVQGSWTVWDKHTSAWTPFDNAAVGTGREYIVRYPNNPPASRINRGGLKPFFSTPNFENFTPSVQGDLLIWHEWPATTVRVWTGTGGTVNPDGSPSAGDLGAGASVLAANAGSKAALRSATTFSYWLDTSRSLVGIKYPASMAAGLAYGGAGGQLQTRILT